MKQNFRMIASLTFVFVCLLLWQKNTYRKQIEIEKEEARKKAKEEIVRRFSIGY